MKLLILSLVFLAAEMIMGRPSTGLRSSSRCLNASTPITDDSTTEDLSPSLKMFAENDPNENEDEGKDWDCIDFDPDYDECSECCDCWEECDCADICECDDGYDDCDSLKRSRSVARSKSKTLAKREIDEDPDDDDYCEECECEEYCECEYFYCDCFDDDIVYDPY